MLLLQENYLLMVMMSENLLTTNTQIFNIRILHKSKVRNHEVNQHLKQ